MPTHEHDKTITAAEFSPLDGPVEQKRSPFTRKHLLIGGVVLISILIFVYLAIAKAVVFKTTPENAELDVSGLGFRLGSNYLLLPGDYELEARAPGYFDFSQTIIVNDGASQEVEVQLTPLPGELIVESALDQIDVFIDGELAGKVPGVLSDIPKGEHLFRFQKHRYFDLEKKIDIEGFGITQSLTLELKPAWGYMNFSSEPSGATLSVNGKAVAVTPARVEVLETGSLITLSLKNHKPWQQELTVLAGSISDHPTISLDIADGSLELSSLPAGAAVTLNDTYQGVTPLTLSVKANQKHQVDFFKKGFYRVKESVTLAPEEQQSFNINLKPILGRFKVAVTPADAIVLIDGKVQGKGSQDLILSAIEHQLEVKKSGYQTQRRKILPKPSLDQSLSVSLLSNAEAYWAQFPTQYLNSVGITLQRFRPNATFTLGAPRREPGRRANEIERRVTLTRPFYLASHEVTNKQFKQFKKMHTSAQVAGVTLDREKQPVANISWAEAAAFCNWLSSQEELPLFYTIVDGQVTGFNWESIGYRLPTETEWAWAAKLDSAGKKHIFPWGNSYPPVSVVGNYADSSASRILNFTLTNYIDKHLTSAPIGSFPANTKKLYDMDGNVSEWINDYYATTPNSGKPWVNPKGPESGDSHVIRGASWRDASRSELRFSYRQYGNNARTDTGFRVARFVNNKPRNE